MLQALAALEERKVIALETIARALSGQAIADPMHWARGDSGQTSGGGDLLPDKVERDRLSVWAEMERNGDRDGLLKACADQGISVPARTKSFTLVKMLESAEEEMAQETSLVNTNPPELPVEEPLDQKKLGQGDPFKVPETPTPPAVGVSKAMVDTVLKEVMEIKGLPEVFRILAEKGHGVKAIKELSLEDYPPVYTEAMRVKQEVKR